MGWGRRAAAPHTPELVRLAAAAESALLAMPLGARQRVLGAIGNMVAAGADLREMPDAFVEAIGRIVFKFLLEVYTPTVPGLRKRDPGRLVLQMVEGAPTLLGPHRELIERLVGNADGAGRK